MIRSTGPAALQAASHGQVNRDSYESDAISAVELRGAISKEELDARHHTTALPTAVNFGGSLTFFEYEVEQ
jgi:hypothetical protein